MQFSAHTAKHFPSWITKWINSVHWSVSLLSSQRSLLINTWPMNKWIYCTWNLMCIDILTRCWPFFNVEPKGVRSYDPWPIPGTQHTGFSAEPSGCPMRCCSSSCLVTWTHTTGSRWYWNPWILWKFEKCVSGRESVRFSGDVRQNHTFDKLNQSCHRVITWRCTKNVTGTGICNRKYLAELFFPPSA